MILSADWLDAAPIKAVVAALQAAKPNSVRFVGGCVRNTIMGRPIDDIDMATQLTPEACQSALEAAGIRVLPTGIAHGTLTALIEGQTLEITSLRRDVETDGRRAVVAFTEDWHEDAQRRDFRLNALYAAPDGELFDPTGAGLEDALAARIVFIGDPDQRLKEDYLRILRFFRFNAWYGGEMDAAGLAACVRQMPGLQKVARERIWKEVHKLLSAPNPFDTLYAMHMHGLLTEILPHTVSLDCAEDLRVTEHFLHASPDALLRLMALIPRTAEAVYATAEALRLSKLETSRLVMWAADNLPTLNGVTGPQLRALLYWHGKQAVADRAMLSGQNVRDLMAAIGSWRRPELPVTGKDALAAGFKGAEIGQALSQLAQAWVASDFSLSREALLDLWVQQPN